MLSSHLRPASRTNRGRRTSRRVAAALTAAAVVAAVAVSAPPTAADTGDVGVQGPSHSGTGTPTGSKRNESVLWFNDGSWWGVLWDTGSRSFHVFRFNAGPQSWTDTGVTVETRSETHHDVLWDGTTLYVASHRFVNDEAAAEPGFPSTVHRFSYDSATDTYTRLGSSQVNSYRTETLVIDKDSTGRLWATWQQGNRIWLNVTGTDGSTWGTPFPHPDTADAASPANVSTDDTPSLVAFGPGKMGVMWSRQTGGTSDGFYWSAHTDGDAASAWSDPVPVVTGSNVGDDHINLKWLDSAGGRVFAAVKTSFTSASQPLIQLLAMDSGGTWTAHTIATVSECPNRVLALIDQGSQRIRTFATYPKPGGTTNAGVCSSSGGAIYEKSTPLNDISFSAAKTVRLLDADQYMHNVSSTKQNLNNGRSGGQSTTGSGLLVVADVSSTSRYWHFYEAASGGSGGDTIAPTVTSVSPADGATGVSASTNVSASFSEAVDPLTVSESNVTLTGSAGTVATSLVYDATSRTARLDPAADLPPGTYTARVRGGPTGVKDLAGNALAADKVWTFEVPTSGGGAPQVVTVPVGDDTYVSASSPAQVFGGSPAVSVDASPVEIGLLKFDLGPYAGQTVTDARLDLRVTTSGSTGRQNVKLVADDSWTEAATSYNTKPGLGATLGTFGPSARDTDHSVALPADVLQGELGGTLSLGLDSASTDGVDVGSGESATPPRLVLTLTHDDGGGGADTTPPTVTSVSPGEGAGGVAPTTNVTATFSEAVDAATVNGSTFTLTTGTQSVAAVVGYDAASRTATLDPSTDLAAGSYTARVTGGADGVRDTAGNPLGAAKVWSFDVVVGTSDTVTVAASADTWVGSDAPTATHGGDLALYVDASPVRVTYLKYDLSALAGRTVTAATLRVTTTSNAYSGSTNTENVRAVADTSWAEGTLTYSTRPATGVLLGSVTGPAGGLTTYDIQLALPHVQGGVGGPVSLAIDSAGSDAFYITSRETSTPPRLVLTVQ